MAIRDTNALIGAAMIGLIHERLIDAAETVGAAKARADESDVQAAINLTLSLSQSVLDIQALLNAMAVLRRLAPNG